MQGVWKTAPALSPDEAPRLSRGEGLTFATCRLGTSGSIRAPGAEQEHREGACSDSPHAIQEHRSGESGGSCAGNWDCDSATGSNWGFLGTAVPGASQCVWCVAPFAQLPSHQDSRPPRAGPSSTRPGPATAARGKAGRAPAQKGTGCTSQHIRSAVPEQETTLEQGSQSRLQVKYDVYRTCVLNRSMLYINAVLYTQHSLG